MADKLYLSKIKIGSNTYEIKDLEARAAIAGGTHFRGVCTDALTDGGSTSPIHISGKSDTYTPEAGDIVIANGDQEFIWDGTAWRLFGDMSDLGTLAYKNSASGSYTPEGTVSAPNIDVTAPTAGALSGVATAGTLPVLTQTVTNETLEISFSQGAMPTFSTANYVNSVSATLHSAPVFSGTEGTVTVE